MNKYNDNKQVIYYKNKKIPRSIDLNKVKSMKNLFKFLLYKYVFFFYYIFCKFKSL